MAFVGVKINEEKLKATALKLKALGADTGLKVVDILKTDADDILEMTGAGGMVLETVDGLIFTSILDLLKAELEKL